MFSQFLIQGILERTLTVHANKYVNIYRFRLDLRDVAVAQAIDNIA